MKMNGKQNGSLPKKRISVPPSRIAGYALCFLCGVSAFVASVLFRAPTALGVILMYLQLAAGLYLVFYCGRNAPDMNGGVGRRCTLIGFILFFSSWIPFVVTLAAFPRSDTVGFTFMIFRLLASGVIILAGNSIGKAEDAAPGTKYVLPKNPLRIFSVAKLLVICMFVTEAIGLIDLASHNDARTETFNKLTLIFGLAAAVAALVRRIQNKKHASPASPRTTVPKASGSIADRSHISPAVPIPTVFCDECGRPVLQNNAVAFHGRFLCQSCHMTLKNMTDRDAAEDNIMHTRCTLCGRDLPQSAFHIIDDRFVCDGCFREMYGGM